MEAEDLMIAANLLKKNIWFEYSVDVDFSWTGIENYMTFAMRSEFEYKLQIIVKTIFEGDGDIYKFHREGIDLAPTFILVAEKEFKD